MGYFANLYVIELSANDSEIELCTNVYGSEDDSKPYLCFGPGERPEGLHPYAGGTVLSNTPLEKLSGYPKTERQPNDDGCLVEADFQPDHDNGPVLFHFVLPPRFIPRRDRKPLDQPDRPIIYVKDDRVIATYPVVGAAVIRFCISPIAAHESLSDFHLQKLLHPDEEHASQVGFELNLGIIKVKFG